MAVSKRLRYEILRRDGHACRYCGATAPDVALTVDHLIPAALGGSDDPSNLVAACQDCNAGKSATPPGAPLVADVEADALRWAQAMAHAAHEQERVRESREALEEYVGDLWAADIGPLWEVPETWRDSVHQMRAAGALIDDYEEAIKITRRRSRDEPWKYFCGVIYGILRQRADRARQLLDSGRV
jgi:hypothetical protein